MKRVTNDKTLTKPVIKTIYTLINKNKMNYRIFTHDKIVKLIDFYQKNQCLWNISFPDFRKQNKRRAALTQIAREFDVSPDEVKRKIRSLRATYLLERRKVLASEKQLRDGLRRDVYKPVLVWYKSMSFLDDVIVHRRPTTFESGPKLSDRFETQAKEVEYCQDVHLEKIEEIYYRNDGSDFERESITDMSTEYLEANYLSEDTEDQMKAIDVDFLVQDCHESFKKNEIEYVDKDNDNLAALKADRIRAEMVYFQKKSEYVDICIEKERRLQPLLIAKLKLEIENLRKSRDDINS